MLGELQGNAVLLCLSGEDSSSFLPSRVCLLDVSRHDVGTCLCHRRRPQQHPRGVAVASSSLGQNFAGWMNSEWLTCVASTKTPSSSFLLLDPKCVYGPERNEATNMFLIKEANLAGSSQYWQFASQKRKDD